MNSDGVNGGEDEISRTRRSTGREDEIRRKRRKAGDEMTAFRDQEDQEQEEEERQDTYSLSLSLSIRSSRARRISSPGKSHSQQPSMTLPSSPFPPPMSRSVQQSVTQQNLLRKPPPQLPPHLSPSHPIYIPPSVIESQPVVYRKPELILPTRQPYTRRNPKQAPGEGKSDTIPAPYRWSTNERATVHSLEYLVSNSILKISGKVQCKRCDKQCEMEYDLRERFDAVATYLLENKSSMHERAPTVWMKPILPTCRFCGKENSASPVINKKREINWLFLLLGQTIGCCTLAHLKYFCKHTKNHRTGAKDRVLYLAYLTLCRQLVPTGPFNR